MGMSELNTVLRAWGQWKNHAEYQIHQKGYGQSVMAKMAQGSVPAKGFVRRTCPKCFGEGRVDNVRCQRCEGAKVVHETYNLVDPRMISATGSNSLMSVTYNTEPPVEYQKIDAALLTMYLGLSLTLLAQYVHYPHDRDNTTRVRFCNRYLAEKDMPLIDEYAYRLMLKQAKQRVAKVLDISYQGRKENSALGGWKAGQKMSKDERKERAIKGAVARWGETLSLKKRPKLKLVM